jgi:hypothetical protein
MMRDYSRFRILIVALIVIVVAIAIHPATPSATGVAAFGLDGQEGGRPTATPAPKPRATPRPSTRTPTSSGRPRRTTAPTNPCRNTPQIIVNKPIREEGLTNALKELRRGDSQSVLINQVCQRGVDFELTPAIEKELRAASASSEMIEAIRTNYRRPTPSPTPKPAPPPTPTGDVEQLFWSVPGLLLQTLDTQGRRVRYVLFSDGDIGQETLDKDGKAVYEIIISNVSNLEALGVTSNPDGTKVSRVSFSGTVIEVTKDPSDKIIKVQRTTRPPKSIIDGLLSQTINSLGQKIRRYVDPAGNIIEQTLDSTGSTEIKRVVTGKVEDSHVYLDYANYVNLGLGSEQIQDTSGAIVQRWETREDKKTLSTRVVKQAPGTPQ